MKTALGIGVDMLFCTASVSFPPLSDLWAWLDSSDISTITKDGSNFVSAQACKLGTNLTSVAQATGTKQPLWVASAKNGRDALRYDGIDDFLQGSYGSDLAQPCMVFHALKINAKIASDDIFQDSGPGGTKRHTNALHWTGSAAQWNPFITGGSAPLFGSVAAATSYVVAVRYNDASSSGWQDTSESAISMATSTSASDGLTIGCRFAGDYPASIDHYETLVYSADVSDANALLAIGYLKAKWAI